jgi:glycosyltransferase involved in cell wall biosynthesis
MMLIRKKPSISVVIPVYNGAKFLNQSLTSLALQSKSDFEAIIIDDGSTDSSAMIASSFAKKDSRFCLIQLESNVGLPTAFNAGITNASSRFLTQLSADDLFGSDYLQSIFYMAEDSGADMLYSDYFLIDDQDKILGTSQVESAELLPCGMVIGVSKIWRRELFESFGGFDPDTFMYEDYEFAVRVWQGGASIKQVPLLPFYYRIHNQQLTNSRRLPDSYFDYRLRLVKDYLKNSSSLHVGRASVTLMHTSFSNGKFKIFFSTLVLVMRKSLVESLRYLKTKI